MADGQKFDVGKLRYDLVPPDALAHVVMVLTHGAAKYADENWRKVPDAKRRYYSALMRHLEAWRQGEIRDPDSGLPHLAHVVTNGIFLLVLSEGQG